MNVEIEKLHVYSPKKITITLDTIQEELILKTITGNARLTVASLSNHKNFDTDKAVDMLYQICYKLIK
jgi:hypothetical protein